MGARSGWAVVMLQMFFPPPFPPNLAAQPVPAGTELVFLPKPIAALPCSRASWGRSEQLALVGAGGSAE